MYKRPTMRKRGVEALDMVTTTESIDYENTGKKFVYRPIQNLQSYIDSLRYHNYTEEFISDVLVKNYKEPTIVHTLDSVKLVLKCGKTKVFCKVIHPFHETRQYFKMGKVPPVEVQIRALQMNGENIIVLRRMFKEYKKSKNKKNYTIHDIFKIPFKVVKKKICL